jgi:hypothetical protein
MKPEEGLSFNVPVVIEPSMRRSYPHPTRQRRPR